MPVLRSQRTYPLSLTADALNTSVVAAYDWAGDPANSRAGGNGADHSGNTRTWTPGGTTPSVIADIGGVTGMDGRDTTVGRTTASNFYREGNLANLGCVFGTGAYSFWFRFRMPSVAVATTQAMQFAQNRNAAGATMLVLGGYEVTSTGKYHPRVTIGAAQTLEWSTAGNTGVNAGAVVDVHVTRSAGGTTKVFVNGVKLATGTDSSDWTTGGATSTHNLRGNSTNSTRDFVLIDEIAWSRELSEAEVAAQQANPYGYYTNSAPADSITVSTPSNSTTVGTSFAISGTYAGGGAPTAIEASFNGSAYQTISAAPSGGTYSGTFTGATAGTGTLTVRWANSTGVSATVTSLTVATAGIAFDAAGTLTSADSTRAVPYKIFQRNGSNQATVRLRGTYFGAPTSIEYRWRSGAWATLVATPSGGTFDATVTLTGPGQGALELRHSNNTGITASMAQVGVGDVWIVAGQSNNVGMASAYTVPVAPGANPTWVPTEMAKDNVWKALTETAGQPFDDRTNSAYPAVHSALTVGGSYFGALSTLVQATGVPVAFIPCALGSTDTGAWGTAGTLWGAMIDRAGIVGAHKGVLWWLGETAAANGVSEASHRSALNVLIEAWWSAKATPWLLININDQGITGSGPIRAAIAAEAAANTAHVIGLADMLGAWATGNVHYDTTTAQGIIAGRVFAVAYPGPTITVQPGDRSVAAGATANFTVTATSTAGAISYQWQRSTDGGSTWANTSTGTGATSASYTTGATTVSGGTANNGDRYRVLVTDANGTTTSASASLAVATVIATITTDAFRDPVTSALVASATIPHVLVIAPATRAVVLSLAGQTTNGSGVMTITSASLTAGVTYLLIAFDNTGANRGAKAYVAA